MVQRGLGDKAKDLEIHVGKCPTRLPQLDNVPIPESARESGAGGEGLSPHTPPTTPAVPGPGAIGLGGLRSPRNLKQLGVSQRKVGLKGMGDSSKKFGVSGKGRESGVGGAGGRGIGEIWEGEGWREGGFEDLYPMLKVKMPSIALADDERAKLFARSLVKRVAVREKEGEKGDRRWKVVLE